MFEHVFCKVASWDDPMRWQDVKIQELAVQSDTHPFDFWYRHSSVINIINSHHNQSLLPSSASAEPSVVVIIHSHYHQSLLSSIITPAPVPTGSLSPGGDVTVYVLDINQPSLPTPFYSVLVSLSAFKALSTVFHSINSPDNSPFSHSALPVLSLPYWSFQLYVSLWKSPSALI